MFVVTNVFAVLNIDRICEFLDILTENPLMKLLREIANNNNMN